MNDDLLRELLITAKGTQAPPLDVPPELKDRFEAAIAQYCVTSQVISESHMILILLQILSKGRADGGAIINKLHEVKVRLELQGEGAIYALLARMEDEGLIAGQFDATMARKTYHVEQGGSKLLNRDADSVRSISDLVATLWAT